ncbi:MAG: hypothetical protein E7270_05115 [Lachnospiraceae bacterium]|nr:hypothetical protein [Lachnospiraceae bacterium]
MYNFYIKQTERSDSMKNKLRLIITILLFFICKTFNYTYASENNTLTSGTPYSLVIPATSYTAYVYYPEYTGDYIINVASENDFECDFLSSCYYEEYSSSFSITHILYENEVCCFSFYNANNFDITITVSIYPDFLPEIDMDADGISIRKNTSTTLNLTVPNIVETVNWTTSDSKVATVDSNGVVKGISYGQATITVSGTTTSEKTFSDSYTVYISDPKLSTKNLCINVYGLKKENGCYYPSNNTIEITGINQYSIIETTYSNKRFQIYDYSSYDYTYLTKYINPTKKGKGTITLIIDGKKIKCTVNVFSAYFSRNSKTVGDYFSKKWVPYQSTLALYKGESTTLKAKGFGNSKIKWSSSNKKVAIVKKGKVTAKGYGSAVITAKVGALEIYYPINVSYKKAIKAIRYANKNHNATYSQAKRMEDGYYDCSSYAWRSYNSAGMNVGPLPNWAPTAADMAAWCTEKGYMIASGIVDTSDLLPGDLIFLCGEDNGRYNGIYHVDLYHGNYTSITVEDVYNCSPYMYNVMVARPCVKNKTSIKSFSPALTSTKSTKNSITLKWSLMHDADGYVIYRKIGENGKYKAIKTINGEGNITYTNKALKGNKNYSYKIRAFRVENGKKIYSQYSEEFYFSTIFNQNLYKKTKNIQ